MCYFFPKDLFITWIKEEEKEKDKWNFFSKPSATKYCFSYKNSPKSHWPEYKNIVASD